MSEPESTDPAPAKKEDPSPPSDERKADRPAAGPSGDAENEEEAEPAIEELSPEEQLARYEESLKNDDWGHQPC